MKPETEKAYRRWRALAEKGYGDRTHVNDLQRIDARIRKAKETYEKLLAAEKEVRP